MELVDILTLCQSYHGLFIQKTFATVLPIQNDHKAMLLPFQQNNGFDQRSQSNQITRWLPNGRPTATQCWKAHAATLLGDIQWGVCMTWNCHDAQIKWQKIADPSWPQRNHFLAASSKKLVTNHWHECLEMCCFSPNLRAGKTLPFMTLKALQELICPIGQTSRTGSYALPKIPPPCCQLNHPVHHAGHNSTFLQLQAIFW
jgi:hypothetical protein